MNLSEIILILYPDADLINEIKIQDDGGGAYIVSWNEALYGPQPTEQSLLDQITSLQQQFGDHQAIINRRKEYPSINELVVALWESVVENDQTALNSIQQKRVATKQKYPKSGD